MRNTLSWADRFALIDAYQPSDEAVCSTFNLTLDELSTARQLRSAGTLGVSTNFDTTKFGNPFAATNANASTTSKKSAPTVHVNATDTSMPVSATKTVKAAKKRGRKGNKIQQAFLAVPEVPVSVDEFCKQHNVSVAVLRQSKRFMAKMDSATCQFIGEVTVRQDKSTKTLMIWKTKAQG